ncbi:MAG: IPTL-CTERM sorting domain-containing protein, partial [Candidatus Hodarchaeales archaeon]
CTTDANGQVSWTYSGVIEGTDIIVASFEDQANQVIGSDPVEKIWVLPTISVPIPTLTQWGLIAMVVVLGIVGFMVIRRRKVTA